MATRCAIREATVEDAARISALLTALAEQFIVGEFSPEGRLHLLASFAAPEMARRLASGEYRFHVAEDGAALAGVVAVRGGSHLCYLFVSTDHQRNGLARRLWEHARLDAMRTGVAPARFTVNASRYAVPAYERLGFHCVGPMQDSNGVRYRPMEWRVDLAAG